jgi:hypothetical protein
MLLENTISKSSESIKKLEEYSKLKTIIMMKLRLSTGLNY